MKLDPETLKAARDERITRYRDAVAQAEAHTREAARCRDSAARLDAQIALLNEQIDGTPAAVSPEPAAAPTRAERRRAARLTRVATKPAK